jgi:hypothetical protein
MGMIASVFRSEMIDCSNGGLSSRFEKVVVVNVEGPFEPSDKMPAVKLVRGNLPNTAKIVPVELEEGCVMFGGTYVATSDSRFGRAVEKVAGIPFSFGAVPFHDRVE